MHYCGAPGSVGSLSRYGALLLEKKPRNVVDPIPSRYFALPADMAPHIPDHLSWEEAGCIQPLAVSVVLTYCWCNEGIEKLI